MGDWVHYNIQFANKEKNLIQTLIDKGFAVISSHPDFTNPVLTINLQKLDSELFKTGYYKNDNIKNIQLQISKDNAIYYSSKWAPDDRLAIAISRCLPDDILYIQRDSTRGYDDYNWYWCFGIWYCLFL